MTEIKLLRPERLVNSPAFIHVAEIPPGATTIYVGGQNAVSGEGDLIGEGDPVAQTRMVMTNLQVALEAAGASVRDHVMMTITVVEDVDLTEAYPVAAEALAGASPAVQVLRIASLAVPGALVEVSAVAAI